MTAVITILAIVIYLALVWVTASIAQRKNHNVLVFAIFAALFPIIALIVVALVRPRGAGSTS